ncbi:hypothetical protein AMS68_003415 [Peltaster fructicola]|uniref:ENTH domain-containing protein n=1 Tax=Peltaster fructicola TaxID=286661 RepID=A0A6H0XTF5_9PEZI|nr:hypothetical protein AMS68_003415 [Peltaster fructicola]
MSHRSFETAVKGATKVKLAPPKSKYVEVILLATQSGEAGVAEVFRTLTHRLRDSTWTVVFKSLIIVHLMIKEGARDVTLSYLAAAPSHRLAINSFTDVQTQGQNIRRYTEYLICRAKAYEKTKLDYVVLHNKGHFKSLTVEKGILRESEIVLDQIKILTRCDLMETDPENEISLTAFRLLTRDLLDLFACMNEAVMNVLQHYFEMSRPDAERAVKIYRRFCTCTEQVVTFLKSAQLHAGAMRLTIPRIKHAPVDLANTLQEYLDDKDFDINRRQYLAQQEAKRNGKPTSTAKFASTPRSASQPSSATTAFPSTAFPPTSTTSAPAPAGPAPDLIDFFDSIEQKQQPLVQSPVNYAQTGFQNQAPQAFAQPGQMFQPQQQPAPFATGNGQAQFMSQQTPFATTANNMGGYQQFQAPAQQQAFPQVDQFGQPAAIDNSGQTFSPVQPQSTNPFRKSMLPQPTGQFNVQQQPTGQFNVQPQPTGQYAVQSQPTGQYAVQPQPIQPQSTNPFARSAPAPQMPPIPQAYQQPQTLQPQRTGTNPFAPVQPQVQAQSAPLQAQQTGTNPFRQAPFVNQTTGTGWQNMQQPTMGGFEQLPTVPVFPRPGQQQSSPWG